MSRRRIEAGISAPSSFSLRTLSGPAPVAMASAPSMAARPGAPPPAITAATGLSFKFNSLATAKPASPPKALEPSRMPANFFSKPHPTGSKESAESMRLTAVVDDMAQRLRKATDAKVQLEAQMQRVAAQLAQERNSAASKLTSMRSEMKVVQDSELRLRGELAQRPAVKEVDTAKFSSRVRSALEAEETNARVADAEARVASLTKRHESLSVEVKLLEGRKDGALAEQASALSAEEVEGLVQKAAAASAQLTAREDARASVEDDIQRYTALCDAHKDDAKKAQLALFKANEATAAAVADEAAAKQQCCIKQAEVDGLGSKMDRLKDELATLSTVASAPTTFSVTGSGAPERKANPFGTTSAQVEALACCNMGVPYHFGHDAPIGVAHISGAAEDPTMDGMVQALVGDLQLYLQQAAADHAKIGRPPVAAVVAVH